MFNSFLRLREDRYSHGSLVRVWQNFAAFCPDMAACLTRVFADFYITSGNSLNGHGVLQTKRTVTSYDSSTFTEFNHFFGFTDPNHQEMAVWIPRAWGRTRSFGAVNYFYVLGSNNSLIAPDIPSTSTSTAPRYSVDYYGPYL